MHKGELPAIPRPFLEHVVASTTAVLANEVFVVFAADPREPPVPPGSPHLLSFLTALAQLPPVPDVELVAVSDRVLEASPTLRRFGEMAPAEARAEQDAFFRKGGYRYPTGRDQAYYSEVRKYTRPALRAGTRVLDVASGAFPAAPLPADVTLVRTDFSSVGVAQAVALDVDEPGVHHLVCDAAGAAPPAAFDIVLFVDSIEHVFDAEAVFVSAPACSGPRRAPRHVLQHEQPQPDLDARARIPDVRDQPPARARVHPRRDLRDARCVRVRRRRDRRHRTAALLGCAGHRPRPARGRRRRSGARRRARPSSDGELGSTTPTWEWYGAQAR